MNQKDYKAISGIIRMNWLQFLNTKGRKSVVEDLADYFEREEGYNFTKKKQVFFRKQFLKDCGVKE